MSKEEKKYILDKTKDLYRDKNRFFLLKISQQTWQVRVLLYYDSFYKYTNPSGIAVVFLSKNAQMQILSRFYIFNSVIQK